jgi:hypothetical protein
MKGSLRAGYAIFTISSFPADTSRYSRAHSQLRLDAAIGAAERQTGAAVRHQQTDSGARVYAKRYRINPHCAIRRLQAAAPHIDGANSVGICVTCMTRKVVVVMSKHTLPENARRAARWHE